MRLATWSLACALWLLGMGLAQPSKALGWTRAQIRGAEAHLDVVDSERAKVTLTLALRISGGWLSELELPGVPEAITVPTDTPATLVSDTGETYLPELVLRHGVWRATFPNRRSAPWRGNYTLTLVYVAPLTIDAAAPPGFRRLRWSMPPWRLGIENAKISVNAPPDTKAADRTDTGLSYARDRREVDGRVLITHQRTQLPRDTQWSVAFDVPVAGASAVETRSVATGLTSAPKAARASDASPHGRWLPYGILLLAGLKMWFVRRLAKRRRAQPRPLVPLRSVAWRGGFGITVTIAASLCESTHPGVATLLLGALTLLAIDRSFEPRPASTLRWSAVTAAQLKPSLGQHVRSHLAPHAWFDLTTPIGAATLTGIYAGLWTLSREIPTEASGLLLVAFLITPLWATATRLHFPWEGARMARILSRWGLRHRITLADLGVTPNEPLVCFDEHGIDRDARLPLNTTSSAGGLLSLDLSWVTDARSLRRKVALLAQVVSGSDADLRLRDVPVSARRAVDGRVVHVMPSEYIVDALGSLNAAARGDATEVIRASERDRAAA